MKKLVFLIAIFILGPLVKAQKFSIKAVEFRDAPIGFLGMAQDSFGYIWLADNGNGLYKYDGKKAFVYKPEPNNPNSISSGRIENVLIDREGILWLPHFETGLDRFDSESEIFTHYRHSDLDSTTICSDAVRDVVEDFDGNLWVGTNLGLDKFDKKKGIFIHNFSQDPDAKVLRHEHVRKLYVDKSGIVWIGTGSVFNGEETTGGLFSLNPKTGDIDLYRHTENEHSLVDNRVRAIFEDSRGVFWVGTAGDGLHTMNRKNGTFTRHTYDPNYPEKLSRPPLQNIFNFGVDHITFIEEDEEGFIWIGTYGNGLNRFDPTTEIIRHFGPDEDGEYHIDNLAYWDILKTHDGLLWLASFYSGQKNTAYMLSKLDINPPQFDFFAHEGIWAISQGTNDQLYFGTNEGVQTISGGELNYVFKILERQADLNEGVREIVFDKEGNIWAGAAGTGLYFYDSNSKEIKNYSHESGNNSLSSDYVGTISIRENNEIFVGTMAGLDILNLTTDSFEHFALSNVDFGNQASHKLVTIDGDHRIWVAGSGGIFRLNRESRTFTKYHLGVGNEIVLDLYKDKDGVVWITTVNHGLRRYNVDQDLFQPILDETGFLHKYSFVVDLTQDKKGIFWISTASHLIKYNLGSNQGTLFADDWIPTNRRRYNFGKIMTLSSGEIIFRAETGYFRFHPDDYERVESVVQKPFIEKFIIDETTQSVSSNKKLYESFRGNSTIQLSHDQNNISFQIGYIDFLNNQSEQPLSYKLENYDREWYYTTSGNQINYYQLPSGDYNLSIKAQDIFGNWGTKNLSVSIATPWYQSWWAYIIYGLIFISGVISIDRFQRKRLLKKAREETREKELEQAIKIKEAYDQLEVAHMELKSTQSQLIQSEKMASLGELTAGIAHEIQNPLNFVNNFSEVNEELITELNEELDRGNLNEVKSMLNDLYQNQSKIKHHGKRADTIVKSMLQHSRVSSGQKELTDINALCDEYIRLAYHGLRARDKSFNAEFRMDLDPDLPKVKVVPQDIGRVLLNLINNAFQAVTGAEKPEVIISTKKMENGIEIRVSDNGSGIPDEIKDKIFQPFFTTKPTGQGTGLGLSLSYDIVKAHAGEIKVESDPARAGTDGVGKGTKFIIQLPIM